MHEPVEQAVQSLHCVLHTQPEHPGHNPRDRRPEQSGFLMKHAMQWLYIFVSGLTQQGQTYRSAEVIFLSKMVMLYSCHLGRLNLLRSKYVAVLASLPSVPGGWPLGQTFEKATNTVVLVQYSTTSRLS